MRAWEFFQGEGLDRQRASARHPILSLRHINKLKRLKAVQRGKHEQRLALWGLIYGEDDADQKELDRRESALNDREEQLRLKELKADIEKAINDAEVDEKARQRLHQMARAELRRQQKK